MIAAIVSDIANKFNLMRGSGRWYGPCPKCGGSAKSNKFSIRDDGGFKCYSCGEFKGNIITWLRQMENMSCPEAHQYASKDCDASFCPAADKCRHGKGDVRVPKTKRLLTPQKTAKPSGIRVQRATDPQGLWLSWAESFVESCSKNIPREIISYLAKRGLSPDDVIRFRLGWYSKNTNHTLRKDLGLQPGKEGKETLWLPDGLVIVIPNPHDRAGKIYRIKIRRPKQSREQFLENLKYYQIEGSGDSPMVIRPIGKSRGVLIIEAELDGLAAAVAHPQVTIVALGTTSAPIDKELHDEIATNPVILVALDADPEKNGKPGAGPDKVKNWTSEFRQAKFWPVPYGKDVGEYFGNSGNLRLWIEAGLVPALPINDRMIPPLLVGSGGRGGNKLLTQNRRGDKAADQRGRGNIPAEVFELRDLLAASGVRLHKRENGRDLGIRMPADYDFGKFHKRLDELVFMNLTVGGYINTLPDGLIGPKGLIG